MEKRIKEGPQFGDQQFIQGEVQDLRLELDHAQSGMMH